MYNGDMPYPHEVILLFTVGFLVEVLLLLLLFFFFFIIVTRVVRVVASGSRGLDCWCCRC
jgi:type II secretory pathway component PulF